MTELTPVVKIPQGDSRELPFSVSTDGSATSLDGATISWRLGRETSPELTLSDSGVEVINRDNSGGTFSVKLSPSATDSVAVGTYDDAITIEDSGGDITQFKGEIYIYKV